MPTVRTGPVIGLIVQVVLLAGLAGTVGLGIAGWLAGIGYGVGTCIALTRGLRRSGAGELGPADRVTLTRAILVGGVAALTVDSFDRSAPVEVMVTFTAVALVLDAVDGRVARRTDTAGAFGARFDMEVDAFLILVLSIHVAPAMGGWVLTIGAMRYAFVVATWVLPWLRGSVPARYWRKVVAAVQGVVLAFATADVLPRPLMAVALAVSLTLLIESFGRDVGWLWRHRVVRLGRTHRAGSSSRVGSPPRVGPKTGTGSGPPLTARPETLVVADGTGLHVILHAPAPAATAERARSGAPDDGRLPGAPGGRRRG